MSTQYENLIRILGNDIPGEKKTLIGLTQIRGIGYMFANSMLQILKINPDSRIGTLSAEQVSSIEKMIQDPKSQNFPTWFLNRQKDVETGDDMHLVTSDIAFNLRNDIEREKGVFSWKGSYIPEGFQINEETVLDIKDVDNWIKEIEKGINAPWVDVRKSTLGGDKNVAIMVKLSLDAEKDWNNKILHNSRYAMIRFGVDGEMEMFAKGRGIKNMRKTKFKTAKDAISKINVWIKKE